MSLLIINTINLRVSSKSEKKIVIPEKSDKIDTVRFEMLPFDCNLKLYEQ